MGASPIFVAHFFLGSVVTLKVLQPRSAKEEREEDFQKRILVPDHGPLRVRERDREMHTHCRVEGVALPRSACGSLLGHA